MIIRQPFRQLLRSCLAGERHGLGSRPLIKGSGG